MRAEESEPRRTKRFGLAVSRLPLLRAEQLFAGITMANNLCVRQAQARVTLTA